MYNNPYSYNPQINLDRINAQIAELEKIKSQIPQQTVSQQPAINQTFQLAPANQGVFRYANSLNDVQKEAVMIDTPFFSRDMSVLWVKNNKGDIKTYELKEIVPKDERDFQIEYLQAQIEELKKGMVLNEQYVTDDIEKHDTTSPSKNDGTTRDAIKKDKPTSVPKISGSKKK